MNVELVLRQDFLYPPSIPEINRRFITNKKNRNPVSFPAIPSLEEMLQEIGHLPNDSLFFGYAEDDLPVVLDLRKAGPSPILISGDGGAGKTDLLKVITKFVALRYEPCEVQLGVITDQPQEWQGRLDFPHCVGLFSMREKDAANLIKALEAWIARRKSSKEAVLLLIDDLDSFARWHSDLKQEMHNILLLGPSEQIWTIATYNPKQHNYAHPWLKYFRSRVFGYTANIGGADEPDLPETKIGTLSRGQEFLMKDSTKWIRFHIPEI